MASKRSGLRGDALARALDKLIERGDRRAEREREMAAKAERASAQLQETVGGKLYPVIYADPPWRFEPRSQLTGMSRAADNHYPTLTAGAIAAIKVPAASDAVLFLWATVAMLPQALSVMAAWGFTYKSQYFWLKLGRGTGYWSCEDQIEELLVGTRGDARAPWDQADDPVGELLVGTRGRVPAPVMGLQPSQLQTHPRGRHSAKPEAYRKMIEEMYPTCARLELFARGAPAPGWDAWGDELRKGAPTTSYEIGWLAP